ncbi:hypothetical protein [Micromonospora cremea]|nr:hypothetical protein [Micromonospora cremea]
MEASLPSVLGGLIGAPIRQLMSGRRAQFNQIAELTNRIRQSRR